MLLSVSYIIVTSYKLLLLKHFGTMLLSNNLLICVLYAYSLLSIALIKMRLNACI